jgi:hypothetical protein
MLVIMAVSQGTAQGGEGFSRVGLSFGGVHIVGLYYEYSFDEVSLRAQMGHMIHAVSFNLTAIRYFDQHKHQPYVGLGVMKHFSNMSFQGANLLCMPLGVDIDLSHNNYVGAEVVPAVSLSALLDGRRPQKHLSEYILPLPSLCYKVRL